MAGIYIHIPFCKQACHYCDFHFSTNQQRRSELVEAMIHELSLQQQYLSQSIETIYLGGGTPSLLSIQELTGIINTVYSNYDIIPNPEVTLEANPENMDYENLCGWRDLGINRLSVGIQSFDDNILTFLNRTHTATMALQAIELARKEGFDNINIDLIYAIPGQSFDQWKMNLSRALQLSPQHISAYTLTIESGTVFGRWEKQGKWNNVDEEEVVQEMNELIAVLCQAGYEHYEVSNFALPRHHSKHNSNYWSGAPYLGIGPSAHSFNGHSRQFNVPNNHHYICSLKENKVPFEIEFLTQTQKINEYLLTTLRTAKGCNLSYLLKEFRYNLIESQHAYMVTLKQQGYLIVNKNHMTLTQKGMMIADSIISGFILS